MRLPGVVEEEAAAVAVVAEEGEVELVAREARRESQEAEFRPWEVGERLV